MKDDRFLWVVLIACAMGTSGFSSQESLSQYYGFGPIEVMKVDAGIHSLTVCDFNGDGLNDIALVNNRRSRIELLIRKANQNPTEQVSSDSDHINELGGLGQFDKHEILLTVKLGNLVLGDFNHDGRMDLAGYGQPAGLYLFYQDDPADGESVSWKAPKQIPVQQAMQSREALAVGDLNQDGLDDMILAGDDSVYLLNQPPQGQDWKPVQVAAAKPIRSVRIADFNHDGLNDIISLVKDRQQPLHIRYGLDEGAFSPVYQYELQALLDYQMLADASFLFYVEQVSGRLTLAASDEATEDKDADFNVLTYPLSKSSKSMDRDMVLADVDGNGLKDVVISFPDDAKVELYLQTQFGLSEPRQFPSLSDITMMQAADVDQDGADEILLLSVQERTIGVSRYDNGRLTFPEPLKTQVQPVSMAVSEIYQSCIYIGKDSDDDQYHLMTVMYDPDTESKPDVLMVQMDGLDSDPAGMKLIDVDQNGLEDLIIFRGYDEPLVYLQTGPYQFEPVEKQGSQSGLIQSASAGNLNTVQMDQGAKKRLLLAQKNFARLLIFQDQQWKVLEQFNAAVSGDQIASAGMYDLEGDGISEVVLLDKKNWQLQILKKDENQTYQSEKTVSVGNWGMSGHFKLFYESLMGTSDKQIILFDGEKFSAISQTSQAKKFPAQLDTMLSWETQIKNGRYAHFALGDVNSDGHTDVVLVELRKKHLDILTFDRSGDKPRLLQGTQFRIFEEKSYSQERSMSSVEPREIMIEDVTGDGAADIVTIMHDRIVIYPQDY